MGAAPRQILLVDDDAAIRAALQFVLEIDGYAVETFESAEALAERAGAVTASDCVVLDYHLPGIDGLSLLMLLRERGFEVPAVIVTSDPSAYLHERAAEFGATVVEKPFLSDDLATAIRSALSRPA